jgi:prepilin-type N-terminal cleavage/methylation domain-containing protein
MKTNKINKNQGFSLIELMVTISIIAIIITMATPASFYQQTSAVNYATTSLQQAKIYASFINDNYTSIYNNAKNLGIQSVTASNVSTYTGGVSMQDRYGSTSCATVRYDSTTNKLYMYMYYTGGTAIQASIVAAANNYLNGIAGQYNGTNYIGAFGTWSIAGSNITSGTCGTPAQSSLAINLNLLSTQVGNMQNDNSLHRITDPNAVGTSSNYNTMQTDILMGYVPSGSSATTYNGIYFTESANSRTKPYLTSGASQSLQTPTPSSIYYTGQESDIVAANANVVAQSFLPKSSASPQSPCVANDLGKIVLDNTAQNSGNIVSTLSCTYDQANCGTAPYLCYLPSTRTSINYTNNSSVFTCPNGFYVDTSIPVVLTSGVINSAQQNCVVSEIGPRIAVPNSNSSVYTGFSSATSSWVAHDTQNGCTEGNIYPGTAIIAKVACTRYPSTYNN